MKRTGQAARVVIDLDFLRDFLDLGRRFAVQERHLFLDDLFVRTLKEVDRIRLAQSAAPQPVPVPDAIAAGHLSPDEKGRLIDLADRRETPQQD